MSLNLTDMVCEGACPALLQITPLQSYRNFNLKDISFPDGLMATPLGIGCSHVLHAPQGVAVQMGLNIFNWTVGSRRITMQNWRSNQLGQFDIDKSFFGQWKIV